MTESTTATKLTLITTRSIEKPQERFTSLIHHLNDAAFLYECYQGLKSGKAPGLDRRTKESYTEEEIKSAIAETIVKLRQKRYRPQPVKRVYIQKANGKQRPLGLPTVTDKIVQLGMKKIMEAIFEPVFLDGSYGFRPRRNCHQAIKAGYRMIQTRPVNWIIDVDVKSFFDTVDHRWLMTCVRQKVNDSNFNRLIVRFLKAGVVEEGIHRPTEQGTPQGGILSPLLANIYLHYVLDLWFERVEKKEIRGYVELIRYADDFIIGTRTREEAERILADLTARFQKFNLTLSPEKTKIIEFGRFAREHRQRQGMGKPDTFDFLGFTHYCSTSRKGNFLVKYKTASTRRRRHGKEMNQWLKSVRNRLKLKVIWKLLAAKLRGHYQYYGVSSNIQSLNAHYHWTQRLAFKWLNRRSQKQSFNWAAFSRYLVHYPLPPPALAFNLYDIW
jgi:group II intron reverse transcriptase/maturase